MFVASNKRSKTIILEIERNQLRSNFDVSEDQFTNARWSRSTRFLDRTLFTIGTFLPPHVLRHDPQQVKT